MKKLLLLAVASVSMLVQATNEVESMKTFVYEKFASLLEESSLESFKEELEKLCLEKDNILALVEHPTWVVLDRPSATMEVSVTGPHQPCIALGDSGLMVFVTGSHPRNAAPVYLHVGDVDGKNEWQNMLVITRIDERTGEAKNKRFYFKEVVFFKA